MKKPYPIVIDDHESFFLDDVLEEVKERAKQEEDFDHNKNVNLGGTNNGY